MDYRNVTGLRSDGFRSAPDKLLFNYYVSAANRRWDLFTASFVNPFRGANHRRFDKIGSDSGFRRRKLRKIKKGKRFPHAGSAIQVELVFIRSSFSSYITHSVRVKKISLRSAVEIGKISSAEVSRRRRRGWTGRSGRGGGEMRKVRRRERETRLLRENRCVARRYRGNFLIWNFPKFLPLFARLRAIARSHPRGRCKFSEGGLENDDAIRWRIIE